MHVLNGVVYSFIVRTFCLINTMEFITGWDKSIQIHHVNVDNYSIRVRFNCVRMKKTITIHGFGINDAVRTKHPIKFIKEPIVLL